MTSTTDPGNKSTAEIQRELEDERRRLRETGRALQDRLSVGTIVDEVLSRTRERGPGYAGNLGRTLRDNPIPVALIGICVAWLMAGGQRASEERFRHGRSYGPGDGRELGLDEEGGYPRPARPFTPPPAGTGAAARDPMERPMAEPGPAGPLGDEPLREPPPAVGPTDPLRGTEGAADDLAATPPPRSPRPGPIAGDTSGAAAGPGASEPLRPRPPGAGAGAGPSDPLKADRDKGGEPLRPGDTQAGPAAGRDRPKDDDEEKPLTLGEDSRSGGLRSATPPPASKPVEGPGSAPAGKRDDKDKL